MVTLVKQSIYLFIYLFVYDMVWCGLLWFGSYGIGW